MFNPSYFTGDSHSDVIGIGTATSPRASQGLTKCECEFYFLYILILFYISSILITTNMFTCILNSSVYGGLLCCTDMTPAKISEKPLWLGDAMDLWKLQHALNHDWSVSNIHCLLIHKECSLQQSVTMIKMENSTPHNQFYKWRNTHRFILTKLLWFFLKTKTINLFY